MVGSGENMTSYVRLVLDGEEDQEENSNPLQVGLRHIQPFGWRTTREILNPLPCQTASPSGADQGTRHLPDGCGSLVLGLPPLLPQMEEAEQTGDLPDLQAADRGQGGGQTGDRPQRAGRDHREVSIFSCE